MNTKEAADSSGDVVFWIICLWLLYLEFSARHQLAVERGAEKAQEVIVWQLVKKVQP